MKKKANFCESVIRRGVIFVLLVLANVEVFAYDFKTSGVYNITSVNTVELTYNYYQNNRNGKYYTGDITIPETVSYEGATYKVTGIGEWAFYYCDSLTSIEIPNSITTIGSYAFFGCTSLTEITIPDAITTIGDQAFNSCWSLSTVEIGSGVTSIGKQAFSYCASVEELNIPENVTFIGDYAFYGCPCLVTANIPDGVESVGEYTFKYCTSLEEATIGSSVTSVGESAFYDCSNLAVLNSKNPTPPTVSSSTTFEGVDKSTCVLNVPVGSKELYASADYWSEFYDIEEVDFTLVGISTVISDGEKEEVERYTIDGIRIDRPQRGINIVKYSDGTIRKVVVK
ncbi:MAG: leucine-rich repeat domain-containing protein [Prevotella sp.]|nr:leucine-rich repeat domain-containing protein [Prevotella sp.]